MTKLQFLLLASAFQGGLVLIAFVLGWWLSVDPLADLRVNTDTGLLGVSGALLLYVTIMLADRFAIIRVLRTLLVEKLGGTLAACKVVELIYLGLLAGVTEEILFRGFLQPWLELSWGWSGGLIFSNMIFALMHWVTPTYALLTGVCGLFLGLLLDIGGERNLTSPIIAHALYDFLAFMSVARSWRQQQAT